MTDGPMYWSSNDQAGWYQSQPPVEPAHQHHNAYQSNSYHQMHANAEGPPQAQIPVDHTSPGPQGMMNNGPTATNGGHHNSHMQSSMPPQTPHTNQQPVNNYNNQQHLMPNVNNVMHDSPNQQPQPMSVPPPPPPQTQVQQPPMQNLDALNGAYSFTNQQAPAQTQMYPQHASTSPNTSYPPQATNSAPPHNQHSNGVSNHGPSPVSSMHQQSPVPQQHQQAPPQASMYPPQQYSPAPYWNSGHPPPPPPQQQQQQPQHQHSAYGPPNSHVQTLPPPPNQQSTPMMNHQGTVSSPPSMDGPPNYPMSNGVMSGPPTQHNQQQQQAPPQLNSNMPYDNRAPAYGSPYPPQAPNYYGAHEQMNPYDSHQQMPQQHHQQQQQQQPVPNHQWSNGYYQPNSSPYQNGPNHYAPLATSYNGAPPSGPPPNHHVSSRMQQPPPSMHNGPPANHHMHSQQQHLAPPPPQQHHHQNVPPSYYGAMQQSQHLAPSNQPHQQQRWPPANQMQPIHAMPIKDRISKGGQEKKPVKPRAPRQRNPNAPAGRRKDPIMTKEHRKSGYAAFYTAKVKELKLDPANADKEFGELSTLVSSLWAQLGAEERATYATEVNSKRKEALKKKASQQALDLVQGITQE